MNKPTRSQWRGYAVLCALLCVLLVILIVRNVRYRHSEQPLSLQAFDTGYHLQEAIELFGDTILTEKSEEKNQRRKQYSKFNYDSSHYNHYKRQPKREWESISIEINSADTTQLQRLYGIGPSFARRIVKYRELLGGYVHKEQLLEVYGMTEDRYNSIASNIVIDTTLIKKIDINNATIEQMRRHPYLDYYQARAIYNHRMAGNRFNSMKDLMLINIIDEKTCTNLNGYIQFNQ